jgi:hypothetical protein
MYGNKIKNMAICLVGLHFLQNYKHHNDIIVNVNYKEYLNNIKTKIYSYFEKDFHVDTFVCTSMSNKLDELLNDYSVVKYCIEEDHNHIKKLKVLELLIDYISETNKQYDVVLMTRFDIYIIDEFTKDNINLDYFNVVSVLEQNCLMDDNLFIFPIEYLISIKNIIRDYINIKNDRSSIHWLLNELQKNVNINYIKNEPGSFVAKLSFFKLRYFDNLELIINRTLFTKNVIYNSNGNTCQIILEEENNVYLNKLISSTGTYCWFGYIIETPGKYNLSFDVYSNKDIIDYDYVKIHNPIKYYKTSNIYAYNWITIGITIEVSESNDKLIFIFDDFNDKIGINFKNILIKKINIPMIMNNGFIINEMNNNNIFKSDTSTVICDNDTCEFIKNETYYETPFIWVGYKLIPEKVKTIMKFDIMFKSDVPTMNDHFYIKTHDPEEHYNDWLNDCKKGVYVHIEIPLVLGKVEQLIIFIMDKCLKPVNFIIKNVEFVPDKINYKFLSFYTQGEPYDKCFNLTHAANNYQKSIEKYVDSTRFFNAYELKQNPETEYLVKSYSVEPKYNQNTHLIGYLRWKPYIILKLLLESNEGDIIYYRDSNIIKYPNILVDIDKTISVLDFVLNENDFFMPVEGYPYIKMKNHVKRECFENLNIYNKQIIESYLLNASIIVCRKSDTSIKLIQNWLDICSIDSLISSEFTEPQHIDFKWNTQEQAILNVLIKKYIEENIFKLNIHKFAVTQRIFSINSLKRVNRVAILLAGEMRNFNNIELIRQNNKNLFELYNCDIFISTWDKKGYSSYHGSINSKDYSDNTVEEDYIKNIYNNIKSINIENFNEWFLRLPETYKEIYNKKFKTGNHTINATVFPQLYKIWDCNRLKTEYEITNNFKYDLVIRFRSDMCLIEEIPEEYLKDYFNIDEKMSENKIYTLNPPKIFYPTRIYDIFFYGNNNSMNKLCNCWLNILDCIYHPYDNGLLSVDSCRVLYVQCLLQNLKVVDITRCIGDIYRDEPMKEYINKILTIFN